MRSIGRGFSDKLGGIEKQAPFALYRSLAWWMGEQRYLKLQSKCAQPMNCEHWGSFAKLDHVQVRAKDVTKDFASSIRAAGF